MYQKRIYCIKNNPQSHILSPRLCDDPAGPHVHRRLGLSVPEEPRVELLLFVAHGVIFWIQVKVSLSPDAGGDVRVDLVVVSCPLLHELLPVQVRVLVDPLEELALSILVLLVLLLDVSFLLLEFGLVGGLLLLGGKELAKLGLELLDVGVGAVVANDVRSGAVLAVAVDNGSC